MASSVAPSSAPVLPSTPIAAADQPKKYLDICFEQLDPSVLNKYESDAYWKDVAGKAAIAGFIALSVGTFVVVGIYAPTFIMITGISIMLVATKVDELVKENFFQPSLNAAANAESVKEFKHHYQDLTGYTPENLKAVLQRMGIFWFLIPDMLQNPAKLNELKPLIAYHQYLEGRVQKLKQQKLDVLHRTTELAVINFEQNRKEINKLHKHALKLDKGTLISTVKDAFVLAAIRQPTLRKTLNDIGSFSKLSVQERVIGYALSYPSVNDFFTFRNTAFAPLTVDEIKQKSVADLSVRLLAAAQ